MDVSSCTYMFRPCLYHVHTMYIHGMYNFSLPWTKNTKGNIMQSSSFEPTIMCITASCLKHYATSMLASYTIVTVYVYCFSTWLGRLVMRRRTSCTACPPGCHDVAGQSINMDLFKGQVRGEAGLARNSLRPETAFGPGQVSSWLGSS